MLWLFYESVLVTPALCDVVLLRQKHEGGRQLQTHYSGGQAQFWGSSWTLLYWLRGRCHQISESCITPPTYCTVCWLHREALWDWDGSLPSAPHSATGDHFFQWPLNNNNPPLTQFLCIFFSFSIYFRVESRFTRASNFPVGLINLCKLIFYN